VLANRRREWIRRNRLDIGEGTGSTAGSSSAEEFHEIAVVLLDSSGKRPTKSNDAIWYLNLARGSFALPFFFVLIVGRRVMIIGNVRDKRRTPLRASARYFFRKL